MFVPNYQMYHDQGEEQKKLERVAEVGALVATTKIP